MKRETINTKADAWRTVGRVLQRREPEFPLAGEVAQRIADHHEARLPLGWESVGIVAPPADEPQNTSMGDDHGHD
jgi:hypothetical protein